MLQNFAAAHSHTVILQKNFPDVVEFQCDELSHRHNTTSVRVCGDFSETTHAG